MLRKKGIRISSALQAFTAAVLLFAAGETFGQEADPEHRLKELEAKEASLSRQLSTSAAPSPEQPAIKGKTAKGGAPAADLNLIQKAMQDVQNATKSVQEENRELRAKYNALQKNHALLEGKCGSAQATIESLQQRSQTAEETARRLAKELDETRGRLMVAETQVERYNARYGGRLPTPAPAQSQIGGSPVDLRSMPGAASQDMPLATVLTQSAGLRTGPGNTYSTLMTVEQGTSLPVEGRQGEWLKVITPMGARAWIHSGACRVGRTAALVQPEQLPRSPKGGLLNDPEEAAFNSINGALKTQTGGDRDQQ